MLIYKIFRAGEWDRLSESGATQGAPIDLEDGYIHLSTAEQVRETAAKHFAGEDGLMLAALDAEALGDDLRWEPSRGGQLFPHLYREMRLGDVKWSRSLPRDGEGHVFPEDLG